MGELIGLYHLDRDLESLVKFVDSKFGVPESIMLELPTNWRKHQGRLTNEKYFHRLAEEYESRGTRIIAGDKNRHIVEPPLSEWLLDLEEKLRNGEWNPNTLTEWSKEFFGVVGEILRYKFLLNWNMLSPSKDRIRNQGFLEAFNEENPEVIVVGDSHARYLKSERPDVHYTYFMTDSPLNHFLHARDNIFWRRVAYDSLQVSPSSRS
ncbi:MAG: hypothetical protein AABX32_04130 [Nanoarchaeota archaeon]